MKFWRITSTMVCLAAAAFALRADRAAAQSPPPINDPLAAWAQTPAPAPQQTPAPAAPAYPPPDFAAQQTQYTQAPNDAGVQRPLFAPPGAPPVVPPLGVQTPAPRPSSMQPTAPGPGFNAPRVDYQLPREPELRPFQPGQTIATVGKLIIIASEVPGIARLSEAAEQIEKDPRISSRERTELRRMLADQWHNGVRKELDRLIEIKLSYSDFLRTVPAEGIEKIQASISEDFENKVVPGMFVKDVDPPIDTRAKLEAELRKAGMTLEERERTFIERTVAHQWERQQVKATREVTHEMMVDYYRTHADEFAIPARARWEQLSVKKSKYWTPEEALAAIEAMGNEVFAGRPWADVAKAGSHGPTARSGGRYDWTTQGSLASKPVDEVIFGLPVGSLSQVIEDPTDLHIVRVIERQEASQRPFTEVQSEIREKLTEEDKQRQIAEFKAKLRERIPVWTIFDDPIALQRISNLPPENLLR